MSLFGRTSVPLMFDNYTSFDIGLFSVLKTYSILNSKYWKMLIYAARILAVTINPPGTFRYKTRLYKFLDHTNSLIYPRYWFVRNILLIGIKF